MYLDKLNDIPVLYWSAKIGNFLTHEGKPIAELEQFKNKRLPTFAGTFAEWCETLVEKTLDHCNVIDGGFDSMQTEPISKMIIARKNIFDLYSNSYLANKLKVDELDFKNFKVILAKRANDLELVPLNECEIISISKFYNKSKFQTLSSRIQILDL